MFIHIPSLVYFFESMSTYTIVSRFKSFQIIIVSIMYVY